ncbi:MAG: hypothetical protein V1861_02400 [Candidatus Micrarchaeota archaeon]
MDSRIIALLVVSGLSAMLLFGCLSGAREKLQDKQIGTQQQNQSVQQPAKQFGGKLGDVDISPVEEENETEVLPDEDLLPPPDEVPKNTSSTLTLDVSDIAIDMVEDDFPISDEDIVEPA